MKRKPKKITEIFYPEEVVCIAPTRGKKAAKNKEFLKKCDKIIKIGIRRKSVLFVVRKSKFFAVYVNKNYNALCKQMLEQYFIAV